MKKRKVFLLFSLIVLMQSVNAQKDSAMFSIKDCLEYASQNNSNIKNSKTDERIARQQNFQVAGRGLPQASINANWVDNLKLQQLILPPAALAAFSGAGKTDTTKSSGSGSTATPTSGGIPLGYKYNSNVTGEVTQMILDPSFWVGMKAAKYNRIYAAQSVQLVNEQTSFNIANAYYQVLVVQKQIQLLQANLNSTSKLLSNTTLQFENGVAKQVDVDRIKVNFNNLNSQLKQAQLNLVQSANNLKFQMGMPLDQSIHLTDTNLTFKQEPRRNEPEQNYSENRNNFRLAKTSIVLQDLDKSNNVVGYLPTLTGFANYAYIAQGANPALFKTENNKWVNYTTASFGLRFRVTIFDGLQRNSMIQQSKLKTKKLEESLILTKENINLEVSNANLKYNSTLERIDADQQNVSLAEKVYQVTQLEYKEGVGTSTDVVSAETSLRQAQNTYINTLLDLYKAKLEMERAKGNLISYLNSNQ